MGNTLKMKTHLLTENRIALVTEQGTGIGEFERMQDGFWYYWPAFNNGGAYTDYSLLKIADMLTELNKEWNETIARNLTR